MSKFKNLFGAVLSTLLFSGAVVADGVTNDASGDIMTGHSADHKDPALMNPSKAQAPDMGHTNEQNKEDITHQITAHKAELSSSPSSPPEMGHQNEQNKEDMMHQMTENKK
ncbi:hypothetical protein [Sedimenticola selenatireducens]|uniref:hypothetical protein n=1 Tax=Sedimenticola selenatireducens TaxID=191960 RepID=UPI0012F98C85|nr:hypothetical protein [Sedimenticola selenatireducens]